MSPALLLLLIAQSDRRPTEHAWCRDDEDVSHNRASIRRILNGTKWHTEKSATSHTWWGPPLESIPHTEQSATQSKVSHHTRGGGNLLNLWGPPLESVGLPPVSTSEQSATWSKVPHHTCGGGRLLNLWGSPLESMGVTSRIYSPHRTKYHMEQSATPHTWWWPPLESVGATTRIHSPHRTSATWSKVSYHTRGGATS